MRKSLASLPTMSARRLCSLLSCLTFINVPTALAQVSQYEGDDLRIVAVSWDYIEARRVGPNGPWHAHTCQHRRQLHK